MNESNYQIPPEMMAHHASDNMLILTAVLGVFIGIAISLIGKFGRQMWMFVWGIGLILVSTALGISMWMEFDLAAFLRGAGNG